LSSAYKIKAESYQCLLSLNQQN